MAITIKGRVARKLFPKSTPVDDNGFKIYAFVPNDPTGLNINEYGNISVKGVLPELILNEKEYEFEVEYESKGKYQSYNVTKVLTSLKPTSGNEAMTFLCGITSPSRAQNILAAYPKFVDMVMNNEEINVKKIKGVGEKTLAPLVRKIKAQFVYYDLITEYKDYNLTMNQIKKLYEFCESIEEVRIKMQRNPYRLLCSVGGIGFKTADAKILNNNEKFRKSPFRMSECVLYCLTQNEINGNTYMMIDDLYNDCKELSPECMEYFYRALEKSDRIFLHEDRQRVAKMETYLCEKEICELLIQLNSKIYPNGTEEKKPWVDCNGNKLSKDSIDEKYKQINGIVLTEQQNQTIPLLIENNIVILAGYAGAGKSSSCQAVINWLEDNCKSYLLLAPTGRASSILSGYTDRPASTIHRALGSKGDFKFTFNEDNKLTVDCVIVDESTMADAYLFRALLRALPDWCKLMLVCDPAQLPSVGAGNIVQDMIRSDIFAKVMLDKVFRYGEGGLSYVATEVRKGNNYLSKDDRQVFGLNEDYVFEETEDADIVSTAVKKYVNLVNSDVSINDIVIISTYNKGQYGTFAINNMIQNIINPKKEKNDGKVGHTKDNVNIMFNVGDMILMTRNNYHVELAYEEDECTLYNGDFGSIKEITDDGELICWFGNNTVRIPKQDAGDFLLGYSVSCHKMQGDNRKHVIYITPKSHSFMASRNLHYVALTRAKSKLYHYGNRETVRKSLYKSDNLSRKTFLEQLLRNFEKN